MWNTRAAAMRLRTVVLSTAVLAAVLGVNECPDREARKALWILRERLAEQDWGGADLSRLRIHLYRGEVNAGDRVEVFVPAFEVARREALMCQSDQGCLLFFVDTDHLAHFAHPTVVALWELDTHTLREPIIDEWWPMLNGQPIFDTVRKREDWSNPVDPDEMTTIVFPWRLPDLASPGINETEPARFAIREPKLGTAHRMSPLFAPGISSACRLWAVIVNGYEDDADTFHLDTQGAYTVLTGHNVPTDQIFYLCPDPEASEYCEIVASERNLEDVLTRKLGSELPELVPSAQSVCQHLLLFYSAHGTLGGMWCGAGQISFEAITNWLEKVECDSITVVIEGCGSGDFIQPSGASPLDGVQFIFTSTGRRTKSYRDVDDYGDKNPGDIGSETVWGYVEAFGISVSDDDVNARTSFSEAATYAKEYDVTASLGNEPQVVENGVPGASAHSCDAASAYQPLSVELQQTSAAPPAEIGEILRCRCNHLQVKISSATGANGAPPLATARFYWTQATTGDPVWDVDEQGDFRQVHDSTTLLPKQGLGGGFDESGSYSFDVGWSVGKGIHAGAELTLLVVVDSPQDPFIVPPKTLSELVQDPRADAITFNVINPSPCFLFPCMGGNRSCETVESSQ